MFQENESEKLLVNYSGKSFTKIVQIKELLNIFLNNGENLQLIYSDLSWNPIKSFDYVDGYLKIEDTVYIHLLNISKLTLNEIKYKDIQTWYFFIETKAIKEAEQKDAKQSDYFDNSFKFWSNNSEEILPFNEYSSDYVIHYDSETGEEITVYQIYDLYSKPQHGQSYIITFNSTCADEYIQQKNKYPMYLSNGEYKDIIGLK